MRKFIVIWLFELSIMFQVVDMRSSRGIYVCTTSLFHRDLELLQVDIQCMCTTCSTVWVHDVIIMFADVHVGDRSEEIGRRRETFEYCNNIVMVSLKQNSIVDSGT